MEKTINVLTTSSYKLNEFKAVLLPDFEIVSNNLEIAEIQSIDQREVIISKAKQAFAILQKPLCVDDFGFYIDKFNSFPGAMTKFIFKSLGYGGLLKLVDENEPAHYKSTIAYIDGKDLQIFEGVLAGKITKKIPKMYMENSPINSVFIPNGYSDIFEKVKDLDGFISHRRKALDDLKKYLLSI